jgi:predicted GIY-YIG superfamily endonuclease
VTSTPTRAERANVKGAVGVIYLLHFDRALAHAKHYVGWTTDLEVRLDEHGGSNGSALMRAVKDAGIGWSLARTWLGNRDYERRLKARGKTRCCPICQREEVQLDHVATEANGGRSLTLSVGHGLTVAQIHAKAAEGLIASLVPTPRGGES